MAINFKKLFEDSHVPTRDAGTWVNTHCPFCVNPPDTHFNGGFDMLSPHYNCWRCGTHSWYDALSKILNIPVNQVKNITNGYNFYAPTKQKKVARGENLNLPGFKLNEQERQYLINRGYDVDYLINKFHIRGGGIAGEWSYRILLPIYYKRVLVSWTGRSILSKEELKQYEAMGISIPRYKNLDIEQSVIAPKDMVFNYDNSNKDSVMIVEGPFDVLKIGENCVCSLGTSVTREQELFLRSKYKRVFICFDNEYEAQEKARHLGRNLASLGMEVEVVNICEPFTKIENGIIIPKNDPGELTYDEVNLIKKELGII